MKMIDTIEEMNKKSSREGIRCECGHCHIEFLVSKNIVRRALRGSGKGSYCSNECRRAARKLIRVIANCKLCNKEFVKPEGGWRNKVFCSLECGNKYAGIARTDPSKMKQCRCGQMAKSYGSKYCSRKCSSRFVYEDFIRRWLDGEEKGYGDKYFQISNQVRRYIKEKYHNECARCGWNQINPSTGNVPVQIDHIDGDASNCKEENLILLCPNCHSLTPTFGSLNKSSKRKFRLKYTQNFPPD